MQRVITVTPRAPLRVESQVLQGSTWHVCEVPLIHSQAKETLRSNRSKNTRQSRVTVQHNGHALDNWFPQMPNTTRPLQTLRYVCDDIKKNKVRLRSILWGL